MTHAATGAPSHVSDTAWKALEGAYDLHIHVGPDVIALKTPMAAHIISRLPAMPSRTRACCIAFNCDVTNSNWRGK